MTPDQRFGRLTVTGVAFRRKGHAYFACRCDCGAEAVVRDEHLRSGRTSSCGCFRREDSRGRVRVATQANVTHGQSRRGQVTPEYRSWHAMLQRCEDPKHPAFHNYGGRGIRVCERWHQLENFVADMGPRPADTTLDRVDVDGDYQPGNCRWASRALQRANQRPRRRP